MSRHRLFVVPTRSDVPVDIAIDHWEQRHGPIFAATPGLLGYVQHQPTRADQHRLGGLVCAEAWFADRDSEVCGYRSSHYRGAVTDDEALFVDRAKAWAALVLDEEARGPAADADSGTGVEVVAVGCDPGGLPEGVPARILTMDRPGPAGGPAAVVIAAVGDEETGRHLAGLLTADLTFVARRNPVKPPAT